jgi:hypothetical protein
MLMVIKKEQVMLKVMGFSIRMLREITCMTIPQMYTKTVRLILKLNRVSKMY